MQSSKEKYTYGTQKNPDIELFTWSDVRNEKIAMEIQIKRQPAAQINQEKGIDNLEIELVTEYYHKNPVLKCPLTDFLEAIYIAQEKINAL